MICGLEHGRTLWDASLLLSRFLSLSDFAIRGQSVIELGSGTGLCAIVAHRLGAKEVVATDTVEILPLLQRNIDMALCESGRLFFLSYESYSLTLALSLLLLYQF